MAKACAYCAVSVVALTASVNSVNSLGVLHVFPQKVDDLLLVVALSTHTKTAKLTTATLQHSPT